MGSKGQAQNSNDQFNMKSERQMALYSLLSPSSKLNRRRAALNGQHQTSSACALPQVTASLLHDFACQNEIYTALPGQWLRCQCTTPAAQLLRACIAVSAVSARSSSLLCYCLGSANCFEAASDVAAAVPLRAIMTVM